VESTNNYAMGLIHEGMARHGMAVFAHEQTKGKGQRNKSWVSASGRNIALSVILEPQLLNRPPALFLLSKTIACATASFVNKYAKESVSVKWPNDIYWRDRKAAGILIENVWQGNQWKYAIAGIGINVNQTAFEDLGIRPVSLMEITGREERPQLLARELCHFIEEQYQVMLHHPERVEKLYHDLLYRRGEMVAFRNGSREFEALVQEVDQDGRLVVFHQFEERFGVGELEWL
jgi:BirA family biotin operon repressor/biotin-[acetyl-CoA-carboxylase] ligase